MKTLEMTKAKSPLVDYARWGWGVRVYIYIHIYALIGCDPYKKIPLIN